MTQDFCQMTVSLSYTFPPTAVHKTKASGAEWGPASRMHTKSFHRKKTEGRNAASLVTSSAFWCFVPIHCLIESVIALVGCLGSCFDTVAALCDIMKWDERRGVRVIYQQLISWSWGSRKFGFARLAWRTASIVAALFVFFCLLTSLQCEMGKKCLKNVSFMWERQRYCITTKSVYWDVCFQLLEWSQEYSHDKIYSHAHISPRKSVGSSEFILLQLIYTF